MADKQAKSTSTVPVHSCESVPHDADATIGAAPSCVGPSCAGHSCCKPKCESKSKFPFSTTKKRGPYTNEEERLEAEREEAQQVIRYLAVSTAPLKGYFGDGTDLPDNFLLYTTVDKLRFTLAIMHSISNYAITQQVETAGLTGTIEGKQAVDNVDTIFTSMTTELNRLRELSIRLPPSVTPSK